jgi:hypothetical protein
MVKNKFQNRALTVIILPKTGKDNLIFCQDIIGPPHFLAGPGNISHARPKLN